ncbi:DUF2269 family protein [Litoribacillus peritrichatus]|uniref:DUF2269 domain-containing protein n=1 Tax=Litoribacillus peritrichatus TaxID=718191 RepID=A0ABP7MFN2_9GAMM
MDASTSYDSYLILKGLHLLGMVLFLGNIIITAWWKVMADKTRKPDVIAFAQRQVTLTDYVFTATGAGLIIGTGMWQTMQQGLDIHNTYWLNWGYWLFMVSGLIWAAILIPLQFKQAKLAKTFQNDQPIPDQYWKLNKLWMGFGTLATLLPLLNIYWMVAKPLT